MEMRSADVWTRTREQLMRIAAIRLVVRAAAGFIRDHCMMRASALTYTSMLALVPLLAVVLAILKGAGFDEFLRPFLLSRMPVVGDDLIDQMLNYIARANAQAVGGIGFAALLASSWALLSNMEDSLNYIFGVRKPRGYLRRAGEYLSMVIVGSLMLVISTVLQTVVGSPELFERVLGPTLATGLSGFSLTLLPWVSAWLGFAFVYGWLPAAPVRLSAALIAGFIAGTLFQLVQLGYLELQFAFARYHVIYQTLAQIPIVLIWIYISWTVVLFGGELAAVYAALDIPAVAARSEDGALPDDVLGMLVLRTVIDAFQAGEPTLRADQLAARFGISARSVREAVDPLVRAGILVEPDESGYVPAVAPSTISLDRALGALAKAAPPAPPARTG